MILKIARKISISRYIKKLNKKNETKTYEIEP